MSNEKMKISPETVEILKNFSSINQSILLMPGKTLTTLNPQRNMFVRASITEEFPIEKAIYDLPRLMAINRLFNEPDYNFAEDSLTISDGNKKVRYGYAEKKCIVYSEKTPKMPPADIELELSKTDLDVLIHAGSVLQIPDFMIKSKDGKIQASVSDFKDQNSNSMSLDVGETDKEFCMIFNFDSIVKLISIDYKISISAEGIASFSNPMYNNSLGIEYLIAVEARSPGMTK